MDFELTAEEQALAETVKNFVDNRVEPRMVEIEAANQIPASAFPRSMGAAGSAAFRARSCTRCSAAAASVSPGR